MFKVEQFELFNGVAQEELDALTRHIHVRRYDKKTQIITEGDESHCIYFVMKGRVKVYLDDENGKEIIVNVHQAGEFFGELGVIQKVPRTASVITMEDAQLGLLSAADFRQCLTNYPQFAQTITFNLAARLQHATETIRQLGLMDVYGRIVVTFLNLSEVHGDKRIINEKLTQKDIASRVGASREMVARILKDLRLGGYISVEDGLIQINRALPHSW